MKTYSNKVVFWYDAKTRMTMVSTFTKEGTKVFSFNNPFSAKRFAHFYTSFPD